MTPVSAYEMEIILNIIGHFAWDCDVMLFGSRHSGTHNVGSDLDLAFVKKDGQRLTIGRLARIREAFAMSNLPYVVDVVNYNACNHEFKEIIDGGHALIYEGRAAKFPENRVFYTLGEIVDVARGGAVLKGKQNILNQEYLHYLLKCSRKILKTSGILRGNFNSISINLPSLTEQMAIVRRLQTREDACDHEIIGLLSGAITS